MVKREEVGGTTVHERWGCRGRRRGGTTACGWSRKGSKERRWVVSLYVARERRMMSVEEAMVEEVAGRGRVHAEEGVGV